MEMKIVNSLKVLLFSYVPVVVSIYIMILFRAQDLANETLNASLEQGFFNPVTASEAIYSGFIIWTLGALFVGVLAVVLFKVLQRYTNIKDLHYLAITFALAILLTTGLFINKVPFAPEGAIEMFSCGIGYGILVPFFSRPASNISLSG
jgi:hypothetical protein